MFKIIIVEDEIFIRKGLSYLMNWPDLDCVVVGEASDGEEGLNLIDTLHPDIVISDIRMPVMDGLQMLSEAMKTCSFLSVLLSGYSDFEYARQGILLGVKDYITKPVDFDQLRDCILKLTAELKDTQAHKSHLSQAEYIIQMNSILDTENTDKNAANDNYVSTMLHYIHKNYEGRITLQEISQQLGISASYLNTKFKQLTGYTFNSYLNRYRVIRALELMRLKDMKIYEIAEKTGFYDYKYFIKVFKKYTGCTPSRFMDENKT